MYRDRDLGAFSSDDLGRCDGPNFRRSRQARATSSWDINVEKHGAGAGVAVWLRLGSDGTGPSSPIMTLTSDVTAAVLKIHSGSWRKKDETKI